jgi:hypothetical protein
MAEPQDTKTKKPRKQNPDYIRKRLPGAKVQKTMAAIERKISQDEQESDPTKKLKIRELIGLANSMASLGRLLAQADKDAATERKKPKSRGLLD